MDGQAIVEFDVANTHPNELNSVSIKPKAEGVKFYPAEYFIGPMDADELFTIEFDAIADQTSENIGGNSEPINLSLSASYSNGINKHENLVSNLRIQQVEENEGSSSSLIVTGILLVALVAGGILIYRKRQQKSK